MVMTSARGRGPAKIARRDGDMVAQPGRGDRLLSDRAHHRQIVGRAAEMRVAARENHTELAVAPPASQTVL